MLPDRTLPAAVIPVVLAGGAGARLRPWSRSVCPKPFLRLRRGSLLQQTLARVAAATPLIVCAQSCGALAHTQARAVCKRYHLLLEPEGRNTAPAVAAAAAYILHHYGRSSWMLLLPSDQTLDPVAPFLAQVHHYVGGDVDGIVAFGIRPRRPATRFGYMLTTPFGVKFYEKPAKAQARALLRDGACWNSGIWLARVTAVEEAYQAVAPALWQAAQQAVIYGHHDEAQTVLEAGYFNQMPTTTVDRLIMEQYPRITCQTLDLRWRDLGVWPSLVAHLCGF